MQISPIPTLSDDINDIRTRTANIVAEKIIPNEREIYSKRESDYSSDPDRCYRTKWQ